MPRTRRCASGEVEVPQETLNVRRTVLIADRLYYRVRVRSFRPDPVATTVELVLGADFSDVFEVRGIERRTSGSVRAPVRDGDGVRFAYVGEDGEQRETLVELSPAPARIEIDRAARARRVGRGARSGGGRSRCW